MQVEATTQDAYQLLHDGALTLARAEREGIRVDTEYCKRKEKVLTRKINYYRKKLEDTKFYRRWNHIYGAKTNIDSNHQLAELLYNQMGIDPPKTTDSGQGATDEDSLGQLDIPELDLLLEIRKLMKVRDTYLHAFVREQHDGFLHPSFLLHTVRTYRSSSAEPNFQNIPKRDEEAKRICRRAILPRPGNMLVEADFSSLEVMIAACYHKDPVMLEYLEDPKSDMHLDMAKQIFMFDDLDRSFDTHNLLRQAAKNGFVFPQFYGDYYENNARGLAEWVELSTEGTWNRGNGIKLPSGVHISDHFIDNGITSYQKFVDYMQSVEDHFWNDRFSVYNEWRESWVEKYHKKGFLQMYTGFICKGIMRRNEIINYPVQGTAFHCLLKTLIILDSIRREENWNTKIIGQIHDSGVLDMDPNEKDHVIKTLQWIVREHLPSIWSWIIVPLDIEIDQYSVDGPWIDPE